MHPMHRTRVKFCGLTREEDVRSACALGADAVGFVCFAGSPRFVPAERLGALAQSVAPFVTPVLLFVDAGRSEVERALAVVPQALLQFHGAEDPEYCGSFGRPYLRALAMAAGVDLLEFEHRFVAAAAVLADAPAVVSSPGGTAVYGGTGHAFPWERLPSAQQRKRPLILAGGLRADNVAAAIVRVRPYAVDVSSGVESARGVKSVERMRDFLAAVHAADAGSVLDPVAVQGGAA